MKKILIGLVIGLVTALPAGAVAWSQRQEAQPIYGADCSGPFREDRRGNYLTDKNGNEIPDPSGTNARCSVTVYVFDDAGNKCYLAKGSNAAGISCIKEQ